MDYSINDCLILTPSFLGINIPRAMCTGCVMVGLFITAMPQLWGLPGSGTGTGDINSSLSARVLWPLCFVLGFLPYGIMNVICEKELKKGEVRILTPSLLCLL